MTRLPRVTGAHVVRSLRKVGFAVVRQRGSRVILIPVTIAHLEAARRAWRRFGKGNHPAALNFGDCFAYALAKVENEPLLFKGYDFTRTDVEAA